MRKSRFTEAQIMAVLRQAESGVAVPELCREQRQEAFASVRVPSRRLSMKVSPRFKSDFEALSTNSGLSLTQIIRGIVMIVENDLIEDGRPEAMRDLREMAMAISY